MKKPHENRNHWQRKTTRISMNKKSKRNREVRKKQKYFQISKFKITNQFNQKNEYIIIITSNCGITQYIMKQQKCSIKGKVSLYLPIDKYTRDWTIQ